jgi:hypothetical protein
MFSLLFEFSSLDKSGIQNTPRELLEVVIDSNDPKEKACLILTTGDYA